jgi:hypothetical protein
MIVLAMRCTENDEEPDSEMKPAAGSGLFVILGAPHGEQPRRSHIGVVIPTQKLGLEHPPTGHLAGWTVR